ncbi:MULTISPECIES: hypothetical protein [Mesorhizobium]|uniref:DUF955 domain-containing protein n=1 Tax=Mesorhizobium caraganae TaxID=483206 RepID=A0ABV1YRR1_9HYPH|nr:MULTISPECIES: hypothetical protein [unclassified Mesorhizobium]ESX82766.1 hypothetical protein X755_32910 [Mesorhizobium sp. LNJC405B00]ESY20722.1 peptidase [Mesorhizobium sp. LNJC395A00]ESZ03486.1 hypothetical protein X735_33095 [Mesorhizobium sp. L2C085B000]WJI74652.1 DUF955 domain-containing protein [Mesorhizobium sp. C395A]
MMEGTVGAYEADDIRGLVDRILRELGNPEPPLRLPEVRQLLALDLKYYSLSNPTLLQEVAHRMKVAGKQVIARPTILIDVIKKANLSALWIPDGNRILIDQQVPDAKKRWIEAHEVGHSFIPWHKDFLFGDDQYTLDPNCHANVEAEANFAAARLLFLQDRFACEARDVEITFKSIQNLAKRYGNTITTTLWRTVEERDGETPAFGMVSAHPHHDDIGRDPGGKDVRYFIRSPAFRTRFPGITQEFCWNFLRASAGRARRGPIFDGTVVLTDANGVRHEFAIECFCNHHAILTYAVHRRPAPLITPVK